MTHVWMVDLLHKFYYGTAPNECSHRLAIQNELMLFRFVFNKDHYACYMMYYVNQIQRLEEIYPDIRKQIEEFGLSVYRSNLRQTVDLAHAKTFMKSAKKTGWVNYLLPFTIFYK